MSDDDNDVGGVGVESNDEVMNKNDDDGEEDITNKDYEYTETTEESYCEKMQNACTGVCIGILLFLISIALLVWNEGRTVKRAKDIDEGQENVIEIDLSTFNYSNNGISTSYENQLIHTTGKVTTNNYIFDPMFMSSENDDNDITNDINNNRTVNNNDDTGNENIEYYLKIRRNVEMYQWYESSTVRETKTSTGGTRRQTTYSYNKKWSNTLIDSNLFKKPRNETINPKQFPFQPLTIEANPILLSNRFVLNDNVINQFNWYEPIIPVSIDDVDITGSISDDDSSSSSSSNMTTTTTSNNNNNNILLTTYNNHNGFYYGFGTNNNPQVGDTRITLYGVIADTISIIAKVSSTTTSTTSNNDKNNQYSLTSYTTSRQGELLLIERGIYTADQMFTNAESENTTLAWILRFVGFILMIISILLILQPLSTAVDIIPFIGDFISDNILDGCIFPIIAFLIALPITLFVVGLAWLAYRPIIAIPIVVTGLGISIWLCIRAKKVKDDYDNNNQSNNEDGNNNIDNNNDDDGPYKPARPDDDIDTTYAPQPYVPSAPPPPQQQQQDSNNINGFAQALNNPPPTNPDYH